MLASLGIRDL